MKIVPLSILFILFAFIEPLRAQRRELSTIDEHSYKIGFQVNPIGMGPFYRNYHKKRESVGFVYELGITNLRHYREKTIINQRLAGTNPYVFSKINRMYSIRPQFGVFKELSERLGKNSIGILWHASAGPSIGILKPVYVDVDVEDPNFPNTYLIVPVRYNPEVIKPEQVRGYSSFNKGLGESKLNLGISMKTGVEFNWGLYSSVFKSLEVGAMLDIFPSRPEIMYGIENKVFYSAFYISFAFGELK